jgi:hypothetical protein
MKTHTKQMPTHKKHPRASQAPHVQSIVNTINNQIHMLRAILPKVEDRAGGREEGREKGRAPLNNNEKQNRLRNTYLQNVSEPKH